MRDRINDIIEKNFEQMIVNLAEIIATGSITSAISTKSSNLILNLPSWNLHHITAISIDDTIKIAYQYIGIPNNSNAILGINSVFIIIFFLYEY